MSCCSISKAIRKLDAEVSRVGERIQERIIDPVREEGSRIESKTRAELKRIPDNIDKATTKVKEQIQSGLSGAIDAVKDVVGQVAGIIPGSGTIKLIGIGLAVIVGLSILRRVAK